METRERDLQTLAEEAARAFTLQAEGAAQEMQRQADEADKALTATISPFWDDPEGYRRARA